MSLEHLSDAYVGFDIAITYASGDRAELRGVRRRIRRARTLEDQERAELLDRAKYAPGCFPPEVELREHWERRRDGKRLTRSPLAGA